MAAWFPPETLWAASFWMGALFFEGLIHRILLYVWRPGHELEDIPPLFTLMVPTATFFVYLTQILSFILLFFFAVFILRTPNRVRFHRFMLSLILFFAFPALALNGLLIPTHMAGHLLWYYLGTLSLLIVLFLILWHASLRFPGRKAMVFFFLLCLPAVLLILARLLHPSGTSAPGSGSWAGTFYKIGNDLFLFQGLLWPFFIPKGSLFRPVYLLASLVPTLAVAGFFHLDFSWASSVWFAGFRVTLPMENLGQILYFISLWGSLYAIAQLLGRPSWDRFSGILLCAWLFLGYSPYREMEVLPFLSLVALLAIATAFSSLNGPGVGARFLPSVWTEGLPGNPTVSKDSKTYWGEEDGLPVKLTVHTTGKQKLQWMLCRMGTLPGTDPDWICCPVAQIPIARQFFPTLPRVAQEEESTCNQVAIWDRNFFSEEILDDDMLETARNLLIGEVRIWWGQCLEFETGTLPEKEEHQRQFCDWLVQCAHHALVIPPQGEPAEPG